MGNDLRRFLRPRVLRGALLVALGALAVLPLAAPARSRPRFRLLANGSWCWFQDPRAVRVAAPHDKTFVGFIGWDGAVTVAAYDSRSGTSRTYVVGHLYHDDHGSPALLVEPDRRLTVFFSGHDGPQMYYRTTLHPEDISSWGPRREVHSNLGGNRGFTYPNPLLMPAEHNRLYLFWRGTQWGIDYATRTLAGHWSRARHLIAEPGQRPYLKVDSGGSNTIAMAFTDGHPRERITSVYFAELRNGALWHADGRRIASLSSAPVRPDRGDLVYNGPAAGASSWVWDTAFGRDRRPVIVYATFRNTNDHAYYYAHWNGRRWVSHFVTHGGPTISPTTIEQQYSGGIVLDHSHPGIVFLSRKVRGWFEIERWTTSDYGAHWHHSTVVRTPGADNVRPVVARGSDGGPMSLLWLHGHYGSYTTYRTQIAYLL